MLEKLDKKRFEVFRDFIMSEYRSTDERLKELEKKYEKNTIGSVSKAIVPSYSCKKCGDVTTEARLLPVILRIDINGENDNYMDTLDCGADLTIKINDCYCANCKKHIEKQSAKYLINQKDSFEAFLRKTLKNKP